MNVPKQQVNAYFQSMSSYWKDIYASGSVQGNKIVTDGQDQHVILSGTAVRQMVQAGQVPPREFSRPEVAQVLIEAMLHPVG
jgi:ATP sulfurylase